MAADPGVGEPANDKSILLVVGDAEALNRYDPHRRFVRFVLLGGAVQTQMTFLP